MAKQTVKRAFQLTNKYPELEEILKYNAKIKTAVILMQATKMDMEEAMTKRDTQIGNILLKYYNYIVQPTDQVMFMDQTNKILVYDIDNNNHGEFSKK